MIKNLTSLSICLVCLFWTHSAAQTPPPPTVAAAAMNLGLRHLEDANWQQAYLSFDTVLRLAPTYAPAYIGKLCAMLQQTEEQLRDEYLSLIDNEELFKKAIEHADPAYKRQLEGYATAIRERREEHLGNQSDRGNDSHKPGERMMLTINDVEYAFRWCPVGSFMMGSPAGETGRQNNETLHRVTLSRGFWMLETEVTQLMWVSVMGTEPSSNRGFNLPVTNVSWLDAEEYTYKLNALGVAPAGYKFSLPTEAQWEYACRADTTTAYYFGDALTPQQANFRGRQTRDVGSYPANAWGLKDMHGNVWEWCLDRYGDYPSSAVTDPMGPTDGLPRVFRGGSWDSNAEFCRSAGRDYYVPSRRDRYIGLRLALVFE